MTLIAIPSEAQQDVSTGEATNPAVSCANGERQVASFTGSGSQTTDSFSITAQQWRYLHQATSASGAGNISIEAIDEAGNSAPFSGSCAALLPNTEESSIDIDGLGTFRLEIVADRDVTYSMIVCQRATPSASPSPASSPAATTVPENTNVVISSIPRKPLPFTGGLPVSVWVGGFVLTGAGLLGFGLTVRRGPRRRQTGAETRDE